MLEKLKADWNIELSWEEQINICEQQTKFRKQIWDKRNIKAAKVWCPNCKEYHESRPPSITIRSMLFALKKVGVINDVALKKLDNSWKKYRNQHNLDACGKKA